MNAARDVGLRWLRSGWVPAALVVALAAFLLHRNALVQISDLVRFGCYLLGWLVLPGTLAWRWAGRRSGPRPLAQDLTIGALVGYVLEFPVYLGCLAVGHPRLYLAWPALVVLATLVSPTGRSLWRRTRIAMPLRWSWGASALLAYVVLWFGANVWRLFPLTRMGLRRPYVDEPYHLALASGLKHAFPPEMRYVDDTPLKYHWLSHLHMAASSWASGVEPIVLLRALAVPTLILLVCAALAHAAVRLTGAHWAGLVALGGLLVAPVDLSGWTDGNGDRLLSTRLVLSPSAGFVNAALLVAVVLCIEILRGRTRGAAPWVLTGIAMVAMLGAKSTSLPTLMAGLIAAAVVSSALKRRVQRREAGLAALAVACFVGATPLFFGAGSHGLVIDPFAFVDRGGIGRGPAVLASVYFLGFLATGAGLVALLVRGGWRRSENVFIIITCLAGIGATLTFHQEALSEYYFTYVVLLPILLGGVLGLHRVLGDRPSPALVRAGLQAVVAAFLAGLLLVGLDRNINFVALHGSSAVKVLQYFVLPMLVVLAVVAAVTVGVVAASRRRGSFVPAVTGVAVILAFAGIGLAPTARTLPELVRQTWNPPPAPVFPLVIGYGGLDAARWLRSHTDADAKIATNAHCLDPKAAVCSARNFWMAGYSERKFLVEGWSYVAWESVGLTSPTPNNTKTGPFWDPERLAANDAAFLEPSAKNLDRLRDEYGVTWLLVDRRFPVNVPGLLEHADLRFQDRTALVFELR